MAMFDLSTSPTAEVPDLISYVPSSRNPIPFPWTDFGEQYKCYPMYKDAGYDRGAPDLFSGVPHFGILRPPSKRVDDLEKNIN